MAFSKFFFEQFKEELEEENKKFKAKSETKEIALRKCSHKDISFMDGELRCKCGAAWIGSNLNLLFENLKE